MSEQKSFTTIYSGSEVRVIMLKGLLEKVGVKGIMKNEFQSGISAGFGGGSVNTVQLQVHESELEKVRPIVEDFIKNQQAD